MNAIFFIAAAVAIISTVMVITRLNAVHALLYLVVSLLSVAVIFFALGAPFVAALEVIIYAGAIMVLFVFVVMMLNLGGESVRQEQQWLSPGMWFGPTILSLVLLGEVFYLLFVGGDGSTVGHAVGPREVGASLFGPYLIGVEIAALLLLAGMIGAWHLGRRDRAEKEKEEKP